MKPISIRIVLLIVSLFKSCNTLLCYRCDDVNKPNSLRSSCPGWYRRPVDSLRDFGDHDGLYTHCIDIRLANGTVIYQEISPDMPTCEGTLISVLKEKLMQEYDMEVNVICCEWDRCNGPKGVYTSIYSSVDGNHDDPVTTLFILNWTVIIWTINLLTDS